MKKNNILTTIINTPIKDMFAASFKDELILFVPFEESFVTKKLESFKKILKADDIIENKDAFKVLENEMFDYFYNNKKEFTIPIKLIGTNFQIKVWETLLEIPYGKTISYKEEAKMIKNQKAFRAVANANGKNNLSILIPCHRVISSNGTIGGYTGGIEIKEYLLNLEKGKFI